MIAQVCDLAPYEFIHTFGDAHIYNNHFEQIELQLSREPRPLPTMTLNPNVKRHLAFTYEDFTLENYDPHPTIKEVLLYNKTAIKAVFFISIMLKQNFQIQRSHSILNHQLQGHLNNFRQLGI